MSLHHLASAVLLVAFAGPAVADAGIEAALREFLDTEVRPWAADPAIIEALRLRNAVSAGYSAEQIGSLDMTWRSEVGLSDTPTIDAVASGALADMLRAEVDGSQGAIIEILLMDAVGLNLATSGVTSDMWQGDEPKFSETYEAGPDAVHFGEVEFDESSQTYEAQVSFTITDPATGEALGAMTVGVNAEAVM